MLYLKEYEFVFRKIYVKSFSTIMPTFLLCLFSKQVLSELFVGFDDPLSSLCVLSQHFLSIL